MAESITTEEIKDPNVELIRDQLRDELTFSRKTKRDAKLNQKRFALGETVYNDVYNTEFVAEVARRLKRKTLDVHEYRKLQNALIQKEENIEAFLKVDNAIQAISRDLSGMNTQSKLAAANCCCNIALGNAKACTTLCKFTSPYLIAELESTMQPLVEACAWTIGNLSRGSDKAFSILHAQGCMKSLINLSQQCSDALLPAFSYASLRYIYAGASVIDISDIVKFAEIISNRYPAVSDNDTMWLLAVLSSKPECAEHVMKCIPAVCDYLVEHVIKKDENVQKISACLRIVCNSVSEPSGQVAQYLLKDEMEKNSAFINQLLCYEYVHIKQETLWLIGNLYNHRSEAVQQLVKPIIHSLPSLKHTMDLFNEMT